MDQSIGISSGNPQLDQYLELLPIGLVKHLVRSYNKAIELATLHDVDTKKAGLAALCHDIARNIKGDELQRLATTYGLQIHPLKKIGRRFLGFLARYASIHKRPCDQVDCALARQKV